MDFRTMIKNQTIMFKYLSFVSWGSLFRDYHMQILHEISTENENWLNERNAYIACEFIDFCIDTKK